MSLLEKDSCSEAFSRVGTSMDRISGTKIVKFMVDYLPPIFLSRNMSRKSVNNDHNVHMHWCVLEISIAYKAVNQHSKMQKWIIELYTSTVQCYCLTSYMKILIKFLI